MSGRGTLLTSASAEDGDDKDCADKVENGGQLAVPAHIEHRVAHHAACGRRGIAAVRLPRSRSTAMCVLKWNLGAV